jgi:HAMP domain-containing protein
LGALLYFNLFKYVFDVNLQNQIIDTVRRNTNVLIDGLVSKHYPGMLENDVITSWPRQDNRILKVVYFNGNGSVRWHKDTGLMGKSLPEYDKAGHLETDAVFEAFKMGRHRVIMKNDGLMYEIAIPLKAKDNRIAGVISLDVSREQVKKEINSALLSYLAGAVLIFALMGFALYLFVVRNVVSPIVYLTDSIENISTKSFQLDFVERSDEVGALAKAIESFLTKVKRELEEREAIDKSRHHYEQEWWSSVLAITIPKGSRAIVVDENNNIMHANFELALKKDGPIHLLDIFGGTQQDIVHIVGQAMDNPGRIFRAKTESGGRTFGIKTLQLKSGGGIIRTVIVLEPLAVKK